MFPILSLSSN